MHRTSFFPRLLIALGLLIADSRSAPQLVHPDEPTTAVAQIQVPKDPTLFHLFILAGQSNMAGRGELSDSDRKPLDRVLSLGADLKWGSAIDPLHFDKPQIAGVGIGRSFAAEYVKHHPGVTVGLIPCAVGGSAIDTWRPGGFHSQTNSHPWDDMQIRVQSAIGETGSPGGVLKGVLWHQGESDTGPAAAEQYESRLVELIQRFRQSFNDPHLPFLIGQLGQFAEKPWNAAVRTVDAAQQRTVKYVPRTVFVASDGLTDKGDMTHFNSASLREFGLRYAHALQWVESLAPVLTLAPHPGNPRNSEGDFMRLSDGRILYVYSRFESGSSDFASAALASRFSDDGGTTWSDDDVRVVENEGGMNVMSVSLLRLADSRIALFYVRKNSETDCRPVVRFSSDEGETWSEPTEIIPAEQLGYYVLNNDRVIQLTSGRLVAPVALHRTPDQAKADWQGRVACYFSDDAGANWRRSKSLMQGTNPDGQRITVQEPGVLERRDGSLLMWVRTDQRTQYQSQSRDQGLTWTPLEPYSLTSPLSPASIERIPATGDLVAVWNDHAYLTSPSRNRAPLSLAISSDDGLTWSDSISISADPDGWYCYTAIDWAGDSLLLAHVAGHQENGQTLSTSVIRKLPLSQVYTQLRHGVCDTVSNRTTGH